MLLRNPRKNLQAVAILVAICMVVGAQYLFTGEIFTHRLTPNTWWYLTPQYSTALVMLLLAVGLAISAAFSQNDSASTVTTTIPKTIETQIKGNRIWLISAGAAYLLSTLIYLLVGANGLVNWLWIAGIGLLVVPLWLQSGNKTESDNIQTWEWILVGVISLIGFALGYWKLTEIPSHVDNDVALMGTYGLELINAGKYNWIGFSGSQHLLSYDQYQAWSMRLFGENQYGVVIHSVILGTLSLIIIFLLGREFGWPSSG